MPVNHHSLSVYAMITGSKLLELLEIIFIVRKKFTLNEYMNFLCKKINQKYIKISLI